MPVYAYVCDKCGEKTALLRSIHDPEPEQQKCVECNEALRRDYTIAAVTFKGTGWGKEAR
jgi:hypothetical protein